MLFRSSRQRQEESLRLEASPMKEDRYGKMRHGAAYVIDERNEKTSETERRGFDLDICGETQKGL